MPRSKSTPKRIRQNLKRRLRNRAGRSALKTSAQTLAGYIQLGKREEARTALKKFCSLLDRAAAKGLVKKNYVRRQKSRLTRKVNALTAAPA